VPTSPGAVGLWAGFLDRLPADEAVAFARDIDAAGIRAIWLQEYSGVDPFIRAALYLSATTRLRVALGVAVIYGRDPEAMVAAASTLEEAFPGRFVLGLGVSHRDLVEARGHEFLPPVPTMAAYLAAMDLARRRRRLPLRILGALGPRMVDLAGRATEGVHTYFAPVAHTASLRAAIGPDRWLAPSQLVALPPDGEHWRDAARSYLQLCLGMPNYTRHLRRCGFTDEDLATTSDALVDALVVPDDAHHLAARIDAHRAAGADHVVVQFVPPPSATVIAQRVEMGLPGTQG
jgi:probable F420-dependent oxidoreductase